MTDSPGADGPVSPTQVTEKELGAMVRKLAVGAGIGACVLVLHAVWTSFVAPGFLADVAARFASKDQVAAVERRLDLTASKEQLSAVEKRLEATASKEQLAAVEKRIDDLATRESIAALSRLVESIDTRLQYMERARNDAPK